MNAPIPQGRRIVIARQRHIDATAPTAESTSRLPEDLQAAISEGRISYRRALKRRMVCNTATLSQGEQVTIVEIMSPMITVRDNNGAEHIVLEGDLEHC